MHLSARYVAWLAAALFAGNAAALAAQSYPSKLIRISQGANPLWSTPDEARVFIRDEIDKWAKVAREAGIKPE